MVYNRFRAKGVEALNGISYVWSNEIPFPIEIVKRTLHALIGHNRGKSSSIGLIKKNISSNDFLPSRTYSNDTLAYYSFSLGLGNALLDASMAVYGIFVRPINEQSCSLTINVYGTAVNSKVIDVTSQQDYCDNFISILTDYLSRQDLVEEWYTADNSILQTDDSDNQVDKEVGQGGESKNANAWFFRT